MQSILTRPSPTLTLPGLSSNSSGMHSLMARDHFALSQSNAFAQKKLSLRSPNGRLPPLRAHPEGFPVGDWKPDWYSRFPQVEYHQMLPVCGQSNRIATLESMLFVASQLLNMTLQLGIFKN